MELKLEERSGKYILRILGYACPYPTLYTLKTLEKLEKNAILEVLTDSQPSRKTIEEKVKERGHEVINIEKLENAVWRITIRKR